MAIAEIHVVLKPALLDVQGATVLKALHQLGHTQVQNVRVGKYITLEVDGAAAGAGLQEQLAQMCQQLLSNPVIEDYEITLDTTAPGATGGALLASGSTVREPVTVAAQPLAAATTLSPTVSTTTPAALIAAKTVPVSALAASEQLAVGKISTSTVGTPDPFAMEYDAYDALPANERLALQELAWQTHGGWIRQQLAERRAAWILCIGSQVVESGPTLDSLTNEARRAQLGRGQNFVPWIFTQPTT